ncbi:hypothetical protein GCM10027162_44630 [Streptomyces incanus]
MAGVGLIDRRIDRTDRSAHHKTSFLVSFPECIKDGFRAAARHPEAFRILVPVRARLGAPGVSVYAAVTGNARGTARFRHAAERAHGGQRRR